MSEVIANARLEELSVSKPQIVIDAAGIQMNHKGSIVFRNLVIARLRSRIKLYISSIHVKSGRSPYSSS